MFTILQNGNPLQRHRWNKVVLVFVLMQSFILLTLMSSVASAKAKSDHL